VFQIETKKTHELSISNQAIAVLRLFNVRTVLIQNTVKSLALWAGIECRSESGQVLNQILRSWSQPRQTQHVHARNSKWKLVAGKRSVVRCADSLRRFVYLATKVARG